MNYIQIENDVKNILSEKRFIHSQGVAKRAVELAKIYGENTELAKIIGIAHDIAKEMPKEQALKYAKENGIEFDEIEKNAPSLWHSKIGADIVEKKYGFTKDMSQAILYHTTGHVNMNTMDKIIYLADKTEENRTYIDLVNAVQIANNDLDEAMLYVAGISIEKSIRKKSLIHPDTIHLINKTIIESNNKNID